MAEANDTAAIRLDNVSKEYGDKLAVQNLSLNIGEGELFAFLGPNGAGKTTTIKMMTGLLRPTRGRVYIVGHDIATDSLDARRVISYVPDQPYLYEKLTGRDFLRFIREIHNLSNGALEYEEELIDTFGMREFVPDLIETYSHGMRQRLAFAGALIHKPKVLVVDEPMVGLDPKSMRIVKDLLRSITRQGTTVFMSTHTLAIAEEVADRIGIIHRGHLVCCGTQEELRRTSVDYRSLEDFFLAVTAEGKA
ncbi:MAG: ABC transporter ATP-binding protein [Planctomycetota bacterium]